MIEFQGELSAECKKYILKREACISLISASIVATVICIAIVVAIFMIHWIFVIAVPVLIVFVALSAVRPSPKYYSRIIPKHITIENDEILSEGEKFCYKRTVTQVKKVLDMDGWYYILFYYPYRNSRFICQKDLLTMGSFNDFEKLFEGKIIKKL